MKKVDKYSMYRSSLIQKMRELIGLNKVKFAEKVGVSRQYYYHLEKGIAYVTIDKFVKIQKVFNEWAENEIKKKEDEINLIKILKDIKH